MSPFGNPPVAQNSTGYAYNQVIAYGRSGRFNFKKINGRFTCNDTTFGNPISGSKACYTAVPDYGFRTTEGGTLTLGSSPIPVAYGADGHWTFKALSGTVSCSNETFGYDPNSGKQKSCYSLDAGYVANEGQWFDLSGPGIQSCTVYYLDAEFYGAGNLVKKSQMSGYCTNSALGGDPAPGFAKQCYAYCTGIIN
jgi:hypothetical protein